MTERTHTPTPWKKDNFSEIVSEKENRAIFWYTVNDDGIHARPEDVDFILRAVNSHQELLKTAKEMVKLHKGWDTGDGKMFAACERLGKAVSRAEGRS